VLAQGSCIHVSDDEAQKIIEVGLVLRQHILQEQKRFSGSFDPSCLSEPKPLMTLQDVLLEGSSSIEDKVAEDQSSISARFRVACTISQLICSNAAKQSSSALTLYQKKERNTISSLCGIETTCKRSSKRYHKYFPCNGYHMTGSWKLRRDLLFLCQSDLLKMVKDIQKVNRGLLTGSLRQLRSNDPLKRFCS